jgi:hypothetical protein
VVEFYDRTEINHKQLKFFQSILTAIKTKPTSKELHKNPFSILFCKEEPDNPTEDQIMTPENNKTSTTATTQAATQLISHTDIVTLSYIIAEQLKNDEANHLTNTEAVKSPCMSPPRPQHSQRIRFNLIRHREASSTQTTLQLFRSFATTLRRADPSVIFHPFSATKQHYSSLHNIKQIQEIEENRVYQYFKPYYQKLYYSLSGYFHISSTITLAEIKALPTIKEWLDINNYHLRQCPSQAEEMVPIGILCYSSPFLHHEELKLAITSHSSWQPSDPSNPPIFDIYMGDFLANGKKTKMLFVSSEKSKQQELVDHFKRLYDGSKKTLPKRVNDGVYPYQRWDTSFLYI